MNILRWLMKHPILLAWLLAIIAILLNFGMSGKTGDHEQEAAAEHGQPAAEVAGSHAGSEVSQQAGDAAVAQAGAAPSADGSATQNAPAQQDVVAGIQAAPAQLAAPVAPPQPPAPAAPAQPAAPVAPAQPAAPAPAAAAATTQQQAEGAASTSEQPADLLRAAREAYWSNELDSAVEFYSSLLKQSPDSIDYKGELANVYWKLGDTEKASALFVEIAPKLAEQGRVTEAFNMKLYVDMVDPELAKQIDAALDK
ncbi:tetratricopeptide repeat protein [Thiothrix nivea]|uniref:Tetratricopeptide repeat protein n=1 Tax=Thiothrix nivea (strain ATCC 35100 / DSM 5205 / JP2) TaxID=870187 RepID=A0A656HF38_THINJ|nr:tetratricopeptide repeat protein [Thiothrix nivea]EIJ35691.1 hypothetical protein Thini_3168 [Thiothrix nivea DSM 5205]